MEISVAFYTIAMVLCIVGMILAAVVIGFGFISHKYTENRTRIIKIFLLLGWIFVMCGLVMGFGGMLYE